MKIFIILLVAVSVSVGAEGNIEKRDTVLINDEAGQRSKTVLSDNGDVLAAEVKHHGRETRGVWNGGENNNGVNFGGINNPADKCVGNKMVVLTIGFALMFTGFSSHF